jgi:hypothetical protein
MLVNEGAMADIKLFTNTIVHEMIHLYNFARGFREKNNDILLDNHGPYFQREMARLNQLGFSIDIVASGETYAGEASRTLYAIVVYHANGKNMQCYFSTTNNVSENFQSFCDAFKLIHPNDSNTKIQALETTDLRVARYTKFPKSGVVPDKELDKWYAIEGGPFTGRILNEYITKFENNKIPGYKEAENYYVLPYNQFRQHMARYRASDDYMRAMWAKFPMRNLNKYIESELITIVGRVRRGSIDKPSLHNKLQDINDAYNGRMPEAKYKEAMLKLLAKVDTAGLLKPEYFILGLR